MQLDRVLERLLQIGRTEAFAGIPHVPELCPSMAVIELLDQHRDELVACTKRLSANDRIALIKSIAILEDQVGGRGSVTHLKRLLQFVSDPERSLLDWILRNTTSYWYYAHGARSVGEHDLACRLKAEQAAEGIQRDLERQARDKTRIAASATGNLYNAVRRGDAQAVRALLAQGADPSIFAPDGTPLVALATSRNNPEIAAELQNALRA